MAILEYIFSMQLSYILILVLIFNLIMKGNYILKEEKQTFLKYFNKPKFLIFIIIR
jgi:hypothetical protein